MKTIPTIALAGDRPRSAKRAQVGLRGRVRFALSMRACLVLVVVGIDLIAALLTGSVIIWKARTATTVEIASSMQLAEGLVADTIALMRDTPTSILLKSIDLHFQSVRHVKIAVVDARIEPVESDNPTLAAPQNAGKAPEWFSALIAPAIETKAYPVVVRGQRIGAVTITSEPSDEIAEAWTYASALLVTAFGLNIAVLCALFVAFGRVLKPLTRLAAGLGDLEGRRYAVRLPQPSLVELATITDHFNRTAEALAIAHDANRRLNLKLVTAQDDERRRTALELHDEVGPCLFALEANATSIANMARVSDTSGIHSRALDVVALVERVQGLNRRVLDRLRPMALGRIPLRDSLLKLLVDLDGDHDDAPQIEHTFGVLRDSYGVVLDLTIYRCVQEVS